MQIDREQLRAQYRSMADEELLDLDRNELTEVAQKCLDDEIESRGLMAGEEDDESGDFHFPPNASEDAEAEIEPDWLETAEQACSFQPQSGRSYGQDSEAACAVLRQAHIPYHVAFDEPDGPAPGLIRVLVPSLLVLKATSVLDKEIFNQEFAETWRSHLQDLSDRQLRDLRPAAVCAGMLDRAARYRQIYEEELARRSQSPKT